MTQHVLYEHSSGLDSSLSVLDMSFFITGLHQLSDHSAAQGSGRACIERSQDTD